MANTRTLHASCLMSKFGFDDGGILGVEIRGYADEAPALYSGHEDYQDVLEELVRTHLLPLLPGVTLNIVASSHNPVRTEQELTAEQEGVSVVITEADARAAAARVAALRQK